jgi:hypothetical protein
LLLLSPGTPVRHFYRLAGLDFRSDVRRIAYWYWELEAVPPHWAKHAADIQELWAPTRFIADAMRRVMPVPVTQMLPGVNPVRFCPLGRAYFGLPEDRFLFLFMFDMSSVMERKNPLAVLRAFRKGFRTNDRAAVVV